MLDSRRYDMMPTIPMSIGDPFDRQIIRLGPATGKIDVTGLCIDQTRHLRPRLLYRSPGVLSEHMDARRVAEPLLEKRPHGLQHFGAHRRRGIVIEIDPSHRPSKDKGFRMQIIRGLFGRLDMLF
jgi:hypothetical protein